jgi:hypothetical protein
VELPPRPGDPGSPRTDDVVTAEGDSSDVFINSRGHYYGYSADCALPSNATFYNWTCDGSPVAFTYNGYVQGQIELSINGGYYKAFPPSEYVG